jgi:bifunctional non-homologous end joining protein LigD
VNIAATTASPGLPTYVEPMLARAGQPFDDERYSFELKWDGVRSLCYVDGPGSVRLMNRRTREMSERYPDVCACLGSLPPGTVLDGEIIIPGADGRPDFECLQVREAARNRVSIPKLARSTPATFIVFDQLYADFTAIMNRPLQERRERAREMAARCASAHVAFSDGVVGGGIAYFQAVVERGLEGIVAKRLDSRYLPGKRTDAWIKVKRHQDMPCVVFGFVPDEEGRRDFRALVIAAPGAGGALRCVGKVGSGFDEDARAIVNAYLWSHPAAKPVVACEYRQARWVEPSLYCTVRCIDRTSDGKLRWPVFRGLIDAH